MSNCVHVAVSCDDNYVRHVAAVFQSLLENASRPRDVRLYLIDAGIESGNIARLRRVVERFQTTLSIIPADLDRFAGLPVLRYGSAVYQRIALADYLPEEVDRALYLDSDLVVLGDVFELWQVDLHGFPVAAVENLSPTACRQLGFQRQSYFNSGVLLMDLDQWRKERIRDQVLSFIADNADRLVFVDQCGMNGVLSDRWCRLPATWNQQSDIYRVYRHNWRGCGYSRGELLEAIRRPKVVHFTGTEKPWKMECFHPYRGYYWRFVRKTPWGRGGFVDETVQRRLGRLFMIGRHFKYLRRLALVRGVIR